MARKLTKAQASAMGKKGGPMSKGRVSPTTQAKIEAREALRKKIEADMEPLYEAWRESALGHFIQVKTASGEIKVFKKAPNAIAIKDMFERAFGKPDQKVVAEVEVSQVDDRLTSTISELENLINAHVHEDDQPNDSDVVAPGDGDTGEGEPNQGDPGEPAGQEQSA